MIQIFLTDGRILVDVNFNLKEFTDLVTQGKNYIWVQIITPDGPNVVAINQIVSFKEVNLE